MSEPIIGSLLTPRLLFRENPIFIQSVPSISSRTARDLVLFVIPLFISPQLFRILIRHGLKSSARCLRRPSSRAHPRTESSGPRCFPRDDFGPAVVETTRSLHATRSARRTVSSCCPPTGPPYLLWWRLMEGVSQMRAKCPPNSVAVRPYIPFSQITSACFDVMRNTRRRYRAAKSSTAFRVPSQVGEP